MSASPREAPQLDRILEALTATPGVVAAVAAADDGLPIAVRLRSQQDGENWAAAAATIGRLAQKALGRLGKSDLEVGVFDTDKFRLLVAPLTLGYLLAACEPGANLGLLMVEMNNAAAQLEAATEAIIENMSLPPPV